MKGTVNEFRENPCSENMRAVIDCVRNEYVRDEDVAHLAEVLGTSGRVYRMAAGRLCVDLASTGGPTSLSTLLGPLYLRALGWIVPKLGVPGRPAGGVDTLSRIPDYKTILTYEEIRACLDKCGYCHFLTNQEYAPLDKTFFYFRQQSNAQHLPELVIASILAKKLAVGLNKVGLEIRVAPHGNFGSTAVEAREYGRRFMRVADLLGIDSVCIITDAREPYQPYVGRGEALLALKKIFDDEASTQLFSHATSCFTMAHATVGYPPTDPNMINEQIKKNFFENLVAQGSSKDQFEQYVEAIDSGHNFFIYGTRSGYLRINLGRLREVILRFQKGTRSGSNLFPDDMGVILKKTTGDLVARGDILASVRVSERRWPSASGVIEDSFCVDEDYPDRANFEVLSSE